MMMDTSSSPFDDALKMPLMGEPVKKRWSLFDSDPSTQHTPLEERFDEIEMDRQEEATGLDSSPMALELHYAEPVPLDLAVLRERQEDIAEVHSSMKQIHEIQKGAFVVQLLTKVGFWLYELCVHKSYVYQLPHMHCHCENCPLIAQIWQFWSNHKKM